jgi:hypothetical protein
MSGPHAMCPTSNSKHETRILTGEVRSKRDLAKRSYKKGKFGSVCMLLMSVLGAALPVSGGPQATRILVASTVT